MLSSLLHLLADGRATRSTSNDGDDGYDALIPLGIASAALALTVLVCLMPLIRSFPAYVRSFSFWFKSSPTSATDGETTSLLGGTSSSALADDAEWEVVSYDLVAAKPSPSFLLRMSAVLLALGVSGLWMRQAVLELVGVSTVEPLLVIVPALTVAHVTLALTSTLVACMDAKRAGLRSAVDIERIKRQQKSLLTGVIFYYILLGVFATTSEQLVERVLVAALVFALGCIQAYLPLGRLQRKALDGEFPPSPEPDASILSILTLSWLNPLMEFGFTSKIDFKDLWNVTPDELTDKPLKDYHDFVKVYKGLYGADKAPPVFYALWRLHWKTLFMQLALVTVDTLLYFTGALFVNRILESTPVSGVPGIEAYAYVVLMFVFSGLRYLTSSAEQQLVLKVGIRIRNLMSALIYEKALTRAPKPHRPKKEKEEGDDSKEDENEEEDASASVGKIVNLMSVDATTIGDWIGYIYTPFMTALQILLCVASLIMILGWSALPGITVLIVLLFSGGPVASYLNKGYIDMKAAIDRRVNAFNEMVHGIKIIKFFAWEKKFYAKIDGLREREMAIRWSNAILEVLNRVLWYSAPFVTTLTTLGFYTVFMGKDLTAPVAFTALALFNLLREPLERFPDTIVQLLDALVSLRRIETFLNEDDLDARAIPSPFFGFSGDASFSWAKPEGPAQSGPPVKVGRSWRNFWGVFGRKDEVGVEVVGGGAAAEGGVFGLRELNARFEEGRLSVIVGATGSGKTTLLLSLLGETHLLSGNLHRPPSATVSYVPQQAWLLNATIRENILFGTALDVQRSRRVIKACALERALELLEGGDLTEVGEKGINLSGGQKQRIAVARACYSRAGVVVLDDPLSAVDAPTAKHLMEECVLGLLADRTRILVTNAAGLAIPRCDDLYVMHSGRLIHQGPVDKVMAELAPFILTPPAYSETASTAGSSLTAFPNAAATTAFTDGLREMYDVIQGERAKFLAEPVRGVPADDVLGVEEDGEVVPKGVLVSDEVGKRLVEDETVNEGAMSPEVYKIYLNAAGGIGFLAVLLVGYSVNHASTMSLDGLVYLWCKAYDEVTQLLNLRTTMASSLSSSSSSLQPSTAGLGVFYAHGSGRDEGGVGMMMRDSSFEIAMRFIPRYFFLMVGVLSVIVGRLLVLAYGGMSAGRKIHRRMMERMLFSPVRFFEVTPVGRIVNRFTKDVQAVDRALGAAVGNSTYNIVLILFVLGAISSLVPLLLVFI
ncbi:hypothetical protein HDU67_008636, partial [Dinochytrium kinnereticum]